MNQTGSFSLNGSFGPSSLVCDRDFRFGINLRKRLKNHTLIIVTRIRGWNPVPIPGQTVSSASILLVSIAFCRGICRKRIEQKRSAFDRIREGHLHVDFHVTIACSTWTPKTSPYVMSPRTSTPTHTETVVCPLRPDLLPRPHPSWGPLAPVSQALTRILTNAGLHPSPFFRTLAGCFAVSTCLRCSNVAWRAQAKILLLHQVGPRRNHLNSG